LIDDEWKVLKSAFKEGACFSTLQHI